jgi:hypothetical protein
MATRRGTRKRILGLDLAQLWALGASFDPQRTQRAEGDVEVLLNNHVNGALPSGSSHRDALEAIARSARPPFEISFLHELLNKPRYPRGYTYFGDVGGQIDQIVSNYGEQRLRWWMAKDGLVVDVVTPEAGPLSAFDQLAGRLTYESMKDGGLSPSALSEVAAKLDAAGFQLRECLQPAQRKPIADHNQRYPKSAVKTFAVAVSNPKFVHLVRRRLYVARDRYQKAHRSVPS